ncbi:MAG: PEP-utilizing enzyme [Proteobacteria bacterium]|nr:PEP-utilizing enzyme [Pseudomonadota bacterium]
MWVHDLRDCDATCGGKAAALARLVAAGLPVPDGFAIDARAFAAIVGELVVDDVATIGHVLEAAARRIDEAPIPEALARAVDERVARLGLPLVVRSSSTIEDGVGGAAAGVFRSAPIATLAELWPAIRGVWASAITPLAATYARHRRAHALATIGVIVQRRAAGEHVTIYTRPPGAPDRDEAWIQRRVVEKVPRDDVRVALALRAEAALGAPTGVDVELVGAHVVQARPIVHPTPIRPRLPPPAAMLAAALGDGPWLRDVTHNPGPLSIAQQHLVELVDDARVAPWRMKIVLGHLYAQAADTPPTAPRAAPATVTALAAQVAAIEATLAAILDDVARPVLARFVAFYAVWATELAPLVAVTARRVPPAALLAHRPSRRPASLAAIAHHAPAWDVAVPTYGEAPTIALALLARWPVPPVPPAPNADPYAALAADLAERDDDWFYRAQAMVRRGYLDRARALGIDPEDVFWIAGVMERAAIDPIDPIEARRTASAARAASARMAQFDMPLSIPPAPVIGSSLHGTGIGPRVIGRVVRIADEIFVTPPNAVLVCPTITPGLALMATGAAALVSESTHVGLLDHGVALARELGITCVVGCRDAWTQLADGMLVAVDGEAGTVTIETVTRG